jgi:D-tyrosyl-tRNA(Tyr) deacylase
MRALIQRVSYANVVIEGDKVGEIGQGLLALVGITAADTEKDIEWLIKKIILLRIFNDENGKMNLSVQDIQGEILVISQFTLFADCAKGNRPSYTRSAHPDVAIPLYERFVFRLQEQFSGKVAQGIFGADMKVSLLNDGPVTIMLDSHQPQL